MNPPFQRTSVVLGTYNGARFLQAQLDSLAAQTLPPCEIIISDDGSTDDTIALAKRFATSSVVPVVVRRNCANLGFGENFLRTALLASGDYVAFCDQDDIWHPEKIARCQFALEQPQVVLAVHTAQLIDGEDTPIGVFTQGISQSGTRAPLSYGPWDVMFGFSMVFDRRLLEIVAPDARGVDYILGTTQLAHDRWILFLANLCGHISEIAEPLADYRQHGGNVFGSGSRGMRKERSRIAKESAIYFRSASEQRALVDRVAASPLAAGTAFDLAGAAAYWDAAVEQQRARYALYHSGSRWMELRHYIRNLVSGVYVTLPDRKRRIKAALKDLRFLLSWSS